VAEVQSDLANANEEEALQSISQSSPYKASAGLARCMLAMAAAIALPSVAKSRVVFQVKFPLMSHIRRFQG